MFRKILFALFIAHFAQTELFAQRRNSVYDTYIAKYASMAVEQMRRYGIPASITLAQALLESAAGRSKLATEANNHFGIKTGGQWDGPYVLRDDDKPNEHFRKYRTVDDSYEDHSLFLLKPRYASLFRNSPYDYKSWAKGLKACGYATSPTYASKLINIIELYELYSYDNGKHIASQSPFHDKDMEKVVSRGEPGFFDAHPVAENNRNYYIRVLPGDNLSLIARESGVKESKLRKYNELPKNYEPEPGSIVYLKMKRKKADPAFKGHTHSVQCGQSMYDIAQMYGMRLKQLYKINQLNFDYTPQVGDELKIF
ncbi:MAG: glucosaminidase domain-containing protein [Bacteroidales bacterium]|nr:glucosaminidase domain-containing protein [Candidatus Physcousia equi]